MAFPACTDNDQGTWEAAPLPSTGITTFILLG